jgi:ATP-dependent protease ClpP protease subunit
MKRHVTDVTVSSTYQSRTFSPRKVRNMSEQIEVQTNKEGIKVKTLFAIGEVNDGMSQGIITELLSHNWEKDPVRQVLLYISSEGGYLHDCFAMIDLLEFFKYKYDFEIITFGLGEIASAGLFLFMVGDQRILFPSCRVFVHEHISMSAEQTYSERLKADKGEETIVYNNYLKYTARNLGLTNRRAKALLKKNKWLTELEIRNYNITTMDRISYE